MLRAIIGVTLLFSLNVLPLSAEGGFSPYVDDKGNINFPAGFRDSMVHLGSWFVPEGGASGFHGVYTERKSVDAFRETGIFPDGTILVQELRASESGDYTTGKGVNHSTKTVKQWFVMVKDAGNRFRDNPVWGDGWSWALFKTDEPGKNLAADYKTDCLGCHVPAKENDWVYTEAYPILNKPQLTFYSMKKIPLKLSVAESAEHLKKSIKSIGFTVFAGIVKLNRTRPRKSRHSQILTSIKPALLGKSGMAVLLEMASTVMMAFPIKVIIN